MKSSITQSGLALKLGISRSTVAAALNPRSPIKLTAETRKQVAQAARKWNYRPDRYARVMRGGKSGIVGLIHFGGLLQVAAERAFYATEALRQANYEIFSADLSWNPKSIHSTCLSMIDARVEGVVVAGLNDVAAPQAFKQLQSAKTPLVVLSGNPVAGAPHFRGDAGQAYFELTQHLIAKGHPRLALMVPLPSTTARPAPYVWATGERVRGFKKALLQDGGTVGAAFNQTDGTRPKGIISDVLLSHNLFDPFATGRLGMLKILALPVLPTAVLCSNDEMAYGAMQACREKKIVIPEQLAITGYDDIALGRCCEIPLTTVQQPNQKMAEAAIETLLALIRGVKLEKSDATQAMQCELIIRASSSTPWKGSNEKGPQRTRSKSLS